MFSNKISLGNKSLDKLAILLAEEILLNFKQRIKDFIIKRDGLIINIKYIRKEVKGYRNINTAVGGIYYTGTNIIRLNIFLYIGHRKSKNLYFELIRVIRHELDHYSKSLKDSEFFKNYFSCGVKSKFTICKDYYLQKQEVCANIAGYKLEASARGVSVESMITRDIKHYFYSMRNFGVKDFVEGMSYKKFREEVSKIIEYYVLQI